MDEDPIRERDKQVHVNVLWCTWTQCRRTASISKQGEPVPAFF